MTEPAHAAPAAAQARWVRVSAVFDAVVATSQERRGEVLHSHCGGDAALRAEVESLLRALARPDDFLDGNASQLVHESAAACEGDDGRVTVPVGSSIGAFCIIREIGRGGMGTVFLAERSDPQLQQRVAIKLMRGADSSGYALRRFVEERRILASLAHPDIARLVDGGVTDDGTPWFAMEHVDGVPLDEYCDARGATVEERIALFCRVCESVQYAHGRLVVHRDLKPSNILVTPDGQPKLLDFGVAKLLGTAEESTGRAVRSHGGWTTSAGLRVVTPAYASPEQLRGEPATTASDVYALGVVLHLLLTGLHPHAAAGSRTHLPPLLLGGDPVPPSQRLLQHGERRERGRARRVRGDLDAIVLKAMHASPDGRYATADHLASDLRRHLGALPVSARRSTRSYRAIRFVRRNRAVVTVAGLCLMLIAAISGVTARQGRQLAAEKNRAAEVEHFIAGLLLSADPYQENGGAMTVSALLDRGIRELAAGTPASPELRARLYLALGKAYHGLGEYTRAVPLIDSSYRAFQRQHGPASPEAMAVANQLADVLRMAGEYRVAADLYATIIAARRAAHGDRSTEVARSLNGLAMVFRMQGRYTEAETLLREALAIDRERREQEPAALAQSLNNLGHVMRERGDLVSAEALHRESLAARRALWGPSHFEVTVSMSNLAEVLRDRGELATADSLFRHAIALRERLVGDAHPDVAMDRARYARLLHLAGRRDSAERLYRLALDVQRRSLAPSHLTTTITLHGLGILLADAGRGAEARPLLAEALAARERVLPAGDPRVEEVRAAWEAARRDGPACSAQAC